MALRRVVNIEIGLTVTKVCEVDFKKKNPKIYKSLIFNTPENTIEDGYIRDRRSFVEKIKDEFEKAGIKSKDIAFTVNSSKILSREVVVPLVKEGTIPGIIEAEKEEYFPMNVSEHELAYTIIEKLPETKQMRLMVYAFPNTLVRNYFNVVEDMGARLVSLDYAGNATFQWLSKNHISEDAFNVVLQVNEQNSMLTLMDNNALALQRGIQFGTGTLIDVVVAESARSDADKAIELLRTEHIIKNRYDDDELQDGMENASEKTQIERQELRDKVTDVVRGFTSNLTRVFEFYSSKNKEAKIAKIYMLGQGVGIKGLDNLIGNELGVEVVNIPILPGLTFKLKDKEEQPPENSGQLITNVGSVISPVHFLNVVFAGQEKKDTTIQGYLILLGATAIACALLVISSVVGYNQAVKERNLLQTKVSSMQYIENVYAEYQQNQAGHAAVVNMDEATYVFNEDFNAILEEMESAFPSETVVHSFSSSTEGFSMSLTVPSKEIAAKFLIQLQKIPYVDNVGISGITEVTEEGTGVSAVTFAVNGTYMVPETEEAE